MTVRINIIMNRLDRIHSNSPKFSDTAELNDKPENEIVSTNNVTVNGFPVQLDLT